MVIEKEIQSLELDFEDSYELYGQSVLKEIVGAVKNDQEIIKIEVRLQFLFTGSILKQNILPLMLFHFIRFEGVLQF